MYKVSVLVPIYNVESYIERCARSLFEQTFTDIEYIFVDDCSPDNSTSLLENVMREYPHIQSVRIIKHTQNQGLAVARNTAVENSSGTYLLHVDSDDYLQKEAIQLLYEKAIATNADMVICDYKLVYKNKMRILYSTYDEDVSEYTKLLLKRKTVVNIIGKLFRKDLVIKNNIYAIAGLNQGEDYLVTPRMAYYSSVIQKVNLPLYNYEKNNLSSYTANINLNAIESLVKVENYLVDFFSQVKDASSYANTLILSQLYNKIILLYSSTLDGYKIIGSLYKDIRYLSTGIELKYKIILTLIDLGYYCFVYHIIQLIKICKGE